MQASNEKLASDFTEMKYDIKKIYSEYTKIRSDMSETDKVLTQMMIRKHNSSLDKIYSPKAQYPSTAVTDNKKSPPLEGGNSTKIDVKWTLKHEISSPKFYELLIKTELKGYTAMYLKNFYNRIKMCPNELTRL